MKSGTFSLQSQLIEVFRVVMTNHTNCTAYLIWSYLTKKQYELALMEFTRDGDKLNSAWFVEGRREIRSAMETLAKENP